MKKAGQVVLYFAFHKLTLKKANYVLAFIGKFTW